jgi:hypothetical protein
MPNRKRHSSGWITRSTNRTRALIYTDTHRPHIAYTTAIVSLFIVSLHQKFGLRDGYKQPRVCVCTQQRYNKARCVQDSKPCPLFASGESTCPRCRYPPAAAAAFIDAGVVGFSRSLPGSIGGAIETWRRFVAHTLSRTRVLLYSEHED